VPDGALFTTAFTPTAETARITFSSETEMTTRSVISNVFNVGAEGKITFYFDPTGGASFDDPDSFKDGTAIGEADMHLQNILTVIGENTGIADGFGDLVQTSALTFTVGAESYQFGQEGLALRASFAGGGVRTNPVIPQAIIAVAGNATVSGYGAAAFLPAASN
jgi:hypothetical protein